MKREAPNRSAGTRSRRSEPLAQTLQQANRLEEAKREFERKYIEKCQEKTAGNITQAAALLGMHRQSLQHKIKELGLTRKFVLSE